MNRICTGIFIVLVGLTVLGRAGLAADDERQRLALEAFEVMKFDKLMKQTSRAVFPQIVAAVKQRHPGVDQAKLDKVGEITIEEFDKLTPELMLQTGRMMLKYYDEDDLRNIIAFYKSKTGQKALKSMPQMTAEIQAWVAPKVGKIMNSVKERLATEAEIQL